MSTPSDPQPTPHDPVPPGSGDPFAPPEPPQQGSYPAPPAQPYGYGQMPPQPQMYPPPPGYPPYYMPRATNGFAIASLVLGILWIYWLGSILALIFGYVARKQIKERNESGGGMAIAGIVLGWIGVGTAALVLALLVIGLLAHGTHR
ncbi:DUF4190 domain-containing protein [Amycolatopsis sp. K13G38]|uniref:DUF4190 domain-containing protein n=1 Tax=Amycolatopsis acididurans TaxID=2724524 RepID=A0ABX1IYP9_9PSEU|nr:DUF4190 domain-containing protein [Amycolatopsis acididurans]NKQ52579.1 DUF4190 domain-containing protein [Amycolatopsis acididurans]